MAPNDKFTVYVNGLAMAQDWDYVVVSPDGQIPPMFKWCPTSEPQPLDVVEVRYTKTPDDSVVDQLGDLVVTPDERERRQITRANAQAIRGIVMHSGAMPSPGVRHDDSQLVRNDNP